MKATITKQSRGDVKHIYSSRYGNRCIAYVDDALTKMVDREFFDKHNIMNLNFECKTWKKICKAVNALVAASLKELFVADYKISYSRKAGCNCGCSPGYVITRHGKYDQPSLDHRDVWVDVEVSDDELQQFKSEWEHRFADLLEQEKKQNMVAALA